MRGDRLCAELTRARTYTRVVGAYVCNLVCLCMCALHKYAGA